jgi:methyl-accepting chemotaxis protein
MNEIAESQESEVHSGLPSDRPGGVEGDAGLARYLPHLTRMSAQLKQTSTQIETSVVDVCTSFQGIAERARSTVARTTGFLSSEDNGSSGKQSFEGLIESCSGTLVKILNTTEEAGQVSQRAIERILQMDKASQMVGAALLKLEQIAHENKMLAMNARIEAAHAGVHGAGFAVVAVEVVSQTERSQEVTSQVSKLIADLRALADSTLKDLRQMNDRDHKRVQECRREADDSLREMQAAHGEMKEMLTGITEEGAQLASNIGSAVRGLQFQDRISQQLAHVVEDLDTLHGKLATRAGVEAGEDIDPDEGFSAYTMREEREVAGMGGNEAPAGDVELF